MVTKRVKTVNIEELENTLQKLNIQFTAKFIASLWGINPQSYSRKKRMGTKIKFKHIQIIQETLGITLFEDINKYEMSTIKNNDIKITTTNNKKENSIINIKNDNVNKNDNINMGSLNKKFNHTAYSEAVEFFYVDGIPDAWKHPKLTTFNFDVEATKIMMHERENIRVIIMPHNKMNGGSYPLRARDILFIDISERDISRAGCYLFTSRNNTCYFLCNINITIEGNVRFSYSNPANASEEKTKSFAELEKLDFRVIGRMFKNATLTV